MLVVGEDHRERAARYSLDTEVEEHLKHSYSEAKFLREKHLLILEDMLTRGLIRLSENERNARRREYLEVMIMDDFEHFVSLCEGCRFDEETFDAYTTENPEARYKYEKCYQTLLEKTGEEATFSNPFVLNKGGVSYIAKKGDINWGRMHMYNTELYKRVYEMCVNGMEPENDKDRRLRDMMMNRTEYFSAFADADEYARHSCSFWCYGVIDKDGEYHEPDLTINDKDWVSGFYDKYIKPLDDNALLSIYEVRSLND